MIPAETMREAAKLLRETAADATPGRWIYYPTPSRRHLDDHEAWTIGLGYCDKPDGADCMPDCGEDVVRTGGQGCAEDFVSAENAAWISLASPVIAEPLTAWLEWAAREIDRNQYRAPRHRYDPAEALDVARAVLGQPADGGTER